MKRIPLAKYLKSLLPKKETEKPREPEEVDWSITDPRAITEDGYWLYDKKVSKEEFDSFGDRSIGLPSISSEELGEIIQAGEGPLPRVVGFE
jgi:hypothetical protein